MSPTDDPFSDLDEALGEEDNDDEDDIDRTVDNPDNRRAEDDDAEPNASASRGPIEAVDAGPAFAFGETKQAPLYARPIAWNELEDTLDFEVQRQLRERGIRDVPKRELHDAALRVAAEQPVKIVAALLNARRSD
jgi:hypothetical protein